MRVRSIYISGRQLVVRVRLTRRADGQRVRVKVRGARRSAFYRSVVRDGHARFIIRLLAQHRRARRLWVTVSYRGSVEVRPASEQYIFRR